MDWKRKAAIANIVAKLPSRLSYGVYYRLQRRFGGLSETNPTSRLEAAVRIARAVRERGDEVEGKTFLEVGTGRRLGIPIGLWLCGASEVVTVDLNPYLEERLVMNDIAFMREHAEDVKRIFRGETAFTFRFKALMESVGSLSELMEVANIHYKAPADATGLDLPDDCIDHFVSYTVFEHIPSDIIRGILSEAGRVMRPGGLQVHMIDFSDHFSHSDRSISAINFLQFSDEEWARYAGNRYQYHNRLRLDDYLGIFSSSGLDPVLVDRSLDERSLEVILAGFPLHAKFASKAPEVIAARNALLVAKAA